MPSAQLKSSAFKNKACHKAPAKVITMNVSGEIVRRYFNYLLINYCFLCQCRKDEDEEPDRHLLIRRAFREKGIFTDYNVRVFVFDLIYFVK